MSYSCADLVGWRTVATLADELVDEVAALEAEAQRDDWNGQIVPILKTSLEKQNDD